MIISHKHKFIFIKTKKTAGTSIEIALSQVCGEEDIITGLPREDEQVRESVGGKGPQHTAIPVGKYTLRERFRYLRKGQQARLVNHTRAGRVRKFIGRRIWNQYYTFCFDRNPWDKAVSLYYWRTRNDKARPEFSQFLRSGKAHTLSNFKIYSVWAKPAVDQVYKYEELDTALADIARKTGLAQVPELPHTKNSQRKDTRPYVDIINDADRRYIEKKCNREIQLLRYTF